MSAMASLTFASDGITMPFVARPPVGGSPGEPDRGVLCTQGFLLALPAGSVPPNLLAEGKEGDPDTMFGPSTVLTVPAVEEEEDGGEVLSGGFLEVLVVDFNVEAFDPLGPVDPLPFSAEFPNSFPDGSQLVSLSQAWVRSASADRTAFYSAQEAPAEDAAGAPDVREPAAPRPRQKRVTTNQLAQQLAAITQLLPTLSSQVQVLTEKHQALEERVSTQGAQAPQVPVPAHRQPFLLPTAKGSAAGQPAISALAGVLGPPPKAATTVPTAAPSAIVPAQAEVSLDVEKPEEDQPPVRSALEVQAEALTQLVTHLIQASEASGDYGAGEPPSQVFTGRGHAQNPRLRAFAPLCPPTWATTTLAFLKETDTILSRRTEASGEATSSGTAKEESPASPKKGPRRPRFPQKAPDT